MKFWESRKLRLVLSVWLPASTLALELHHSLTCRDSHLGSCGGCVHHVGQHDEQHDEQRQFAEVGACENHACSLPCVEFAPVHQELAACSSQATRTERIGADSRLDDQHDPDRCPICRFLRSPIARGQPSRTPFLHHCVGFTSAGRSPRRIKQDLPAGTIRGPPRRVLNWA